MSDEMTSGWVTTEFREIVLHRKGKKPKNLTSNLCDDCVPYLLIDEMEGKPPRLFTNDKSVPIADSDDVLIVWDGSIGKTAKGLKGAIGSTIVALSPIVIPSNFLEYYLKTVKPYIEQTSRGTGLQHINPLAFWSMLFPLPPLNEQRRIAAKLDQIMPRINAVKNRLEKIPVILKRFRQAVLSAAVTGKLTEKWRAEDPSFESIEESFNRQNQNIVELKSDQTDSHPTTWALTLSKHICSQITKGTTPRNNGFISNGIPFIKVYNIVDNQIDFDYKPQFVSNEIHEGFLKRSKVYPGDVLMNIVGPPLGKIAIIPDKYPEWNINQAIAFFRPLGLLNSKYLFIVLTEGNCLKQILIETRGVVGQSNLSLEQCRSLQIPLPPLQEQKEIVQRVERLFALADKLEARYKSAKAKVDKLAQSTLAKAFRGQLVTPEAELAQIEGRTYETAEQLLERIIEEKRSLSQRIQSTRRKK
jgi:type I restriction enzyme, S subunit